VQGQKHVGKVVLLATGDTLVNVRETGAPTNTLADVERIIQVVKELSVPQEQKEVLLALIKQSFAVKSNVSSATRTKSTPSSTSHSKLNPKQRLAAVSTMFKARQIVLKERLKKLAPLVAMNAEQLNAHEPLVDLGLDALIAIAFKNWLRRSLGADIGVHDILDAAGLEVLAGLVAEKSKSVPSRLPEASNEAPVNGVNVVT
jgi:aryl carrier-like protein